MTLVAKPRHTQAHKKRQAGHHRQTKHYAKSYFPYLPMIAIVGLGIFLNSFWMHSPQVLGSESNFTASQLATDTNKQRETNSLSDLSLNPQLNNAAQAKANDMATRDYWSHTTPDSKSFSTFIVSSGYQYQAAGENLAYGFSSAGQVISGWMNSPEHRENILSKNYQNVGFGVASSKNYLGKGPATIVVAEYGQPSPATANVTFQVNKPADGAVKGDQVEANTQGVSRIQVLTGGNAAWSLALVSAIAGAALMLFVIRHGLRIHRMLSRGEQFIASHPWLDVGFVFLATTGFVLTRTGGLIH